MAMVAIRRMDIMSFSINRYRLDGTKEYFVVLDDFSLGMLATYRCYYRRLWFDHSENIIFYQTVDYGEWVL